MTKTTNMYQVRFFEGNQYSRAVGSKSVLRNHVQAKRIVKRLKKSGVEAFAAKIRISV